MAVLEPVFPTIVHRGLQVCWGKRTQGVTLGHTKRDAGSVPIVDVFLGQRFATAFQHAYVINPFDIGLRKPPILSITETCILC